MAYTNIDDPSAHFQAATYTGNGSTQSITNDGNSDLQPDWVWVKNRGATNGLGYQHQAYDSSRGTTKKLLPSATNAESTDANSLTAFNSDGFSAGSNVGINENAVSHVAWQWKANGGTTSSNSDGNITSTVQANTDAGFSIVTWTGNEQSAASVGHGLGVTPEMVLFKRRNATYYWVVYLGALGQTGGNNMFAYLNVNNAAEQGAGITFTSSLLNPGSGATTNSGDMIAYCFNSVQGYSKFGKYVGNGNANGPFVYTGFKPAFIMVKKSSSTGAWIINDSKRIGHNPNNYDLYANTPDDEEDNDRFDLLSNGFKPRITSSPSNSSGATYIFMAFASSPFTTSTGIPTTAR